jgi:hypothetical protein
VRWITTPERAAQWSADTGYVGVTPAAYETEAMKKYVADFPQAIVARDQLPTAVAELSTHENQRVTKALNDGLQAALTGTKTAAAGDEEAQVGSRAHPQSLSLTPMMTTARPRRLHGWLLLLPAMACLALFTHWPAIASFVDSFYVDPAGAPPGAFHRARQLRAMLADPIFWKAMANNLWFAARHDPDLDRARFADGGLGQ